LLQKPIQACMEVVTGYETGLGLICKLIVRANNKNSRKGKKLLLNVEVMTNIFSIFNRICSRACVQDMLIHLLAVHFPVGL